MVVLFIVAAVIMGIVIMFGMIDAEAMPWSCPACYAGAGEDLAGRRRPWYLTERDGRVRCRTCHARFRERPDGTLGPIHDV